MTQAVYEFKVVGNEAVLKAYAEMIKASEEAGKATDNASKKTEKGVKTTSDKAKELSSSFKGLAGDVGVFGNVASESFSRAASDAAGLAEVFTSGSPLLIGIAFATVAVGFLTKAWIDSEEAAGKAVDLQIANIKRQQDAVEKLADEIYAREKDVTKEEVAMQKARAEAAEITQARIILGEEQFQKDLAELRKKAAASFSLDPDKEVRAFVQKREDELKVAKEAGTFRRRFNEMQAKLDAQEKAKADKDAEEKSKREREAAAKKAMEDQKQADAKFLDLRIKRHWQLEMLDRKAIADKRARDDAAFEAEEAKEESDFFKRQAARLAREDKKLAEEAEARATAAARAIEMQQAGIDQQNKMLDLAEEERTRREIAGAFTAGGRTEAEIAHIQRTLVIEEKRIQADEELAIRVANAQRLRDSDDEAADHAIAVAEKVAAARIDTARQEADAKVAAKERERIAEIAVSNAEMARTATAYALAPALDVVNSKLNDLKEVNRDTAQQFLESSEDIPVQLMKATQAMLANLAQQAAGQAAMELGKAMGDFAQAATYAATPGTQGLVPGLMSSGAAHIAAAGAYGALGGVSAGGAFAIGAVRPPTNDEKRTQAQRQDGGATGAGPSSGGGSGMGGSSDNSNASVVYNITYGANSIAPQDERRTAAIMDRAARRNRNDGFARLGAP